MAKEMKNIKAELTLTDPPFTKTGKADYKGRTYSLNNMEQKNFWYDRIIEKNVFYCLQIRVPHYIMFFLNL